MADYTLGDMGEIFLAKKIRPASETFAKLDAQIKAGESGDKYALACTLRDTSEDPQVVKLMAEVAKLAAETEARLAAVDKILAPVVEAQTVSEDDLAKLRGQRETLAAEIHKYVKTGDTVEEGFGEYVKSLDLPGVKFRKAGTGTAGTGGIKPRVVIEIVKGAVPAGKSIVNKDGNTSFTTVAIALGDPKIASDIQKAWLAAAGNTDAASIVEPVTFDFTHGDNTLTLKVSKRLPVKK